jgi:hypothetical protein
MNKLFPESESPQETWPTINARCHTQSTAAFNLARTGNAITRVYDLKIIKRIADRIIALRS